jgi:hypothetical protein
MFLDFNAEDTEILKRTCASLEDSYQTSSFSFKLPGTNFSQFLCIQSSLQPAAFAALLFDNTCLNYG